MSILTIFHGYDSPLSWIKRNREKTGQMNRFFLATVNVICWETPIWSMALLELLEPVDYGTYPRRKLPIHCALRRI